MKLRRRRDRVPLRPRLAGWPRPIAWPDDVLGHRLEVRWWSCNIAFSLFVTAGYLACVLVLTSMTWIGVRAVFGVALVMQGWTLHRAWKARERHVRAGWEHEANALMLGMATSGLFGAEEMFDALRETPPPGASEEGWNQAVSELRQRMLGDG